MKFLKIIGSILVVFLICFIVFYFWARRPIVSESEYSILTTYSNGNTTSIKDTFSIMTYNIGYLSGMTNNLAVERPKKLLEENLEKASQLLLDIKTDIVVFQEIDFGSKRTYYINELEQLANKSGFPYGAVSVNWDKQYVPFPYWPIQFNFGEMLSGQAVLSHSPILSSKRVVLPKPDSNPFYYNDFYLDRLAQVIWISTTSDSICVINVHFEAWDGPTREVQSEIVLDIYRKYEIDHPVILLGDFNCNPPFAPDALMEKTIESLIAYPSISMVNQKADYLKNPEQYLTFNSEKPYVKLDYIFYNNLYLDCLDYEVVHQAGEISDHLPVRAVFTRKP